MKKVNKNKGFTLAEIMICMLVIGIIMSMGIKTIKNVQSSYTSLAYFAHKNIIQMVGGLYSGRMTISKKVLQDCSAGDYYAYGRKCPSTGKYYKLLENTSDVLSYNGLALPPMITQCVKTHDSSRGKGKITKVLKTDGESISTTVSCTDRITDEAPDNYKNLFCKSMVAMANIKGAHDCTTLYTTAWNNDESSPYNKGPYISDLVATKPNFTLSNGMRFYISKWAFDATNVSPDYGYRLIAVDLNGKKGPNSYNVKKADEQKGLLPDIITFMVMDNGEVYPLGEAADNIKITSTSTDKFVRYIYANVKGYYNVAYKVKKNNKTFYKLRDSAPDDCRTNKTTDKKCIDSSGNEVNCKCTFGVLNIPHTTTVKNASRTSDTYSYREALCTARKTAGVTFINYCSDESFTQSDLCPPLLGLEDKSPFDTCQVETIKPAFRFNF